MTLVVFGPDLMIEGGNGGAMAIQAPVRRRAQSPQRPGVAQDLHRGPDTVVGKSRRCQGRKLITLQNFFEL